MSSLEYTRWMAYDRVEPIGDLRADARNAILCATVVNVVRAAVGAKGTPAKPEDFMPWLPREEPDAAALFRSLKASLAATKLAPGEKPPGWTGEIG